MKKILYLTVLSFLIGNNVFAAPPNNVTGSVEAEQQENGILIRWEETTNVDGSSVDHYQIHVDTQSVPDSETYSDIQKTDDATAEYLVTQYLGSPLESGATYYFSIVAVNQDDEESLSYSREASAEFVSNQNSDEEDNENASEDTTDDTSEESENILALVEAKGIDVNTVEIEFNQNVVLPNSNPEDSFFIQNQAGETLEIQTVTYKQDRSYVIITTEEQTEGEMYTVTVLSTVTNEENNPIPLGSLDTADFVATMQQAEPEIEEEIVEEPEPVEEEVHEAAPPPPPPDTTPPEDVTNLRATYTQNNQILNDYSLHLNWNRSQDSDGDLNHYNYQKKTGNDSYSTAIRIEKDRTSYQTVLPGGERYTFKISSVDANGNESIGAITSIILPETGPAAVLGLITLFSAGTSLLIRKRK